MHTRRQLLNIQKELNDRMRRYARRVFGGLSPELKRYYHGYNQTVSSFEAVVDEGELFKEVGEADVILVGEIRDGETADIAVKAALTGHLVFSTLHTNDAAGAIARLVDMGVEPFLIGSSLIATTAQRLMRRLCSNCRQECKISKEVLERFPAEQDWIASVKAYRGAGCNHCKNTGYRGRLAIMEILPADEDIQKLIIENKSTGEIDALARKKGMTTLFDNALLAFKEGQTTLEEVLRVTTFSE